MRFPLSKAGKWKSSRLCLSNIWCFCMRAGPVGSPRGGGPRLARDACELTRRRTRGSFKKKKEKDASSVGVARQVVVAHVACTSVMQEDTMFLFFGSGEDYY